ncbi:hypothetical protein PB2503_08539 [Parvularcula bermudensis HTCC2503]|uniref:Uncharacterized protein n=1 Tax=Parvularcula bermudensis (strain ATCC BAA-594 / HTCC2503 / KCTC 12087) TaxID=314260 RepID=E0TBP2_PARBH|nr:hypothetical protein [Parvularcula bermudensis]ADM09763.1 hypothetical protein PB2503_08539 [Parvularcula bermudensis HTCC2503]
MEQTKGETTPYDELLAAMRAYGDAAMENLVRCRALGRALSDGFSAYLGAPGPCTSLVPPTGPFDPSRDYGDEAFSFSQREVVRLEPIVFGLCVIVPHEEDSGTLWLRTGIKAEVRGGRFDVYIAHQPRLRVPLEFGDHLTPVYDTVKTELLSLFNQDLMHFNDERYNGGIGFVPQT